MYVTDDTGLEDRFAAIDAERNEKLDELYNDLSNAQEAVINGCDSCVSVRAEAGPFGPTLVHEHGCWRYAKIASLKKQIERIEDGF